MEIRFTFKGEVAEMAMLKQLMDGPIGGVGGLYRDPPISGLGDFAAAARKHAEESLGAVSEDMKNVLQRLSDENKELRDRADELMERIKELSSPDDPEYLGDSTHDMIAGRAAEEAMRKGFGTLIGSAERQGTEYVWTAQSAFVLSAVEIIGKRRYVPLPTKQFRVGHRETYFMPLRFARRTTILTLRSEYGVMPTIVAGVNVGIRFPDGTDEENIESIHVYGMDLSR